MTVHHLKVILLAVAAELLAAPAPAAGQQRREQAGFEVALSLGSFPNWTSTPIDPATGRSRRFRGNSVWGASVGFFPSEYVGITATIQTTGIRLGSSDSGFDTWQLKLEGRSGPVGPVTPFAMAGIGSLSETLRNRFQYVTAGAGVRRQLSRSWALSAGVHLLRQTGAANRRGQSVEVDLDPIAGHLGISWRPLRLGI